MRMMEMFSLQLFAEEEAAAEAPAEPASETPAETGAALPQSLLDALAEHYRVGSGDMTALEAAIRQQLEAPQPQQEAEDAAPEETPEEAAEEAPEETDSDPAAAAAVRRIYDGWMAQAAETGAMYPGFDLRQEMGNPRFSRLLRSGVDVRTAYEVLHKDEIIPAAMQYAARTVEQKIASALRVSGNRPSENGMGGGSAALVPGDAAHLSRKDYHEICRRVARGERVSFG